MEDQNPPLDSEMGVPPPAQPLRFSQPVRSDLLETTKWSMFLAILLFILLGILALVSIAVMFASVWMGLLLLALYSVLFFFPAWYYYKFSTLTRQALNFGDNSRLEEGFANLRRFYRWVGIMVIVLFAVYVLAGIVGLSMLGSGNPFVR